MRSNPEPHDRLVFLETYRAITKANPSGEDGLHWVYLLELETWMVWVMLEESIRGPRLLLDLGRQGSKGPPKPLSPMGSQRLSGSSG